MALEWIKETDMTRIRQLLGTAVLLAGSVGGVAAQPKEVTIAYQQIAGPLIVAIANGSVEKATGYKVNWRQFESGAKVATAMTSGDVQVGVIGSSPLAAAVSRGVDLQLFWILDDINEAEALVVRNGSGINKPADLKGKKLGVPFVSTTHFHAMFALEQWGIKPNELEILNMQPNQVAAAWERGDIDAAFVWDPALARIKQTGKVLITSGELSKKGKATFDGIAVQTKWAEANADFMAKLVKVIADVDASFRNNPAAWGPDSPQRQSNRREDRRRAQGCRCGDQALCLSVGRATSIVRLARRRQRRRSREGAESNRGFPARSEAHRHGGAGLQQVRHRQVCRGSAEAQIVQPTCCHSRSKHGQ